MVGGHEGGAFALLTEGFVKLVLVDGNGRHDEMKREGSAACPLADIPLSGELEARGELPSSVGRGLEAWIALSHRKFWGM